MNKNLQQTGRVCILLMDSLGIGASLDAAKYGDIGANTFANIHKSRNGKLFIPNLTKCGIYHATLASSGLALIDMSTIANPIGYYGYAVEQSYGKDTPSGHWELAGVPVLFDWGYFPKTQPCFPAELIDKFINQANLLGILGNQHASGTDIIRELGAQHIETQKPILYTSADSVLQIAAHEQYFGLKKLYDICEIARTLVDGYNIGRVIARPFIGDPGSFQRTSNRRDYTTPPPAPTLLDILKQANHEVIAIGKISDIFAYQGITQSIKANNNMELFTKTIDIMQVAPPGSLIFTNFIDFDSSYGHRRDVEGYAKSLEEFDARLPELMQYVQEYDLVIIAADHGCDPTQPGSDHTREHIPILVFSNNTSSCFIGRRDTFADIGQSIAEYLMVSPLMYGMSFL